MAQEDISFSARFDYKQVIAGFKEVERAAESAKRQIAGAEKQMRSAAAEISSAMKKSFSSSPSAKGMAQDIINNQKRQEAYWASYYNGAKNAAKSSEKVKKFFDMNALSVLFFGQAMQQAGMSVARFGVQAFTDVMHSIEGTVTQTDYLNASMLYLGFVIGQSLEPVISYIVPIIDNISGWVSENQKLTAGLIVSAIVIGGLLFLYATLKLGLVGLINVAKDAWVAFVALSASLNGLEATKLTWANNLKTLLAVGIVAAIVAVLYWIYKLQETMGGWGEFFLSVVRGVLRVFAILGSGIGGVFSEIVNMFKWLWNSVLDSLEWGLQKIVDAINWIIGMVNKIPGMNIPLIGDVDFSAAKLDVKNFGDAFIDTYSKMMDAYIAFEEAKLAPKKGYADFNGFLPQYASEAQAAANAATTNSNTVVYNQNTINVTAGTVEGMEQVTQAFNSMGVNIPR